MSATQQETQVNGEISMDDLPLELPITCPEHPDENVQRICVDINAEKEVLCVECLINLDDPKALGANLVTPSQFVKIAADFYEKAEKAENDPTQVPSECKSLVLKQAENIEKVSKHIEKEKKRVEERFKNLISEFTNLCNKKMEEYNAFLDKQLFNFRYNYVYFEKQLNKVYPSEENQNNTSSYPTREDLVEKIKKLSNTTQLLTLVKNVKQDLKEANFNPLVTQESSEEARKKNLGELLKQLKNQGSSLPSFSSKNTSEEDVVKSLKESIDKSVSKLFEIQNEIVDLTKGDSAPNSKILTTPEQLNLLKKWTNKPNLGLKLLYRASADGFTGTAFHSKCDGKSETITLVKTQNTNKIFGGYLDQAWQTQEAWVNSSKCFVFSLTSKEKYTIKSGHEMYAAYGGPSYGPSFGGGYDFHISGNNGGALLYSFDITDLNNFTGGSSFTCAEIEVFQITSGGSFSVESGTGKKSTGSSITSEIKAKVASYMGTDVSKYSLLYKGSEDGMNPESFHTKCDNKGPTVVFVKVKDSDEVIGGYTTQPWCSTENYALDNDAFVFSIEKDLFCHVAIAESAIFQSSQTGPYFGDDETMVVFKEKQGDKYNVVVNAYDCYTDGETFSNKGMTFEPEEVEVYEVKI